MSNRVVAAGATPSSPVTLTVDDMYTLMPYENSLVVLEMTGPQIKEILERGYRNYYYFKYVPDYGGYSHYTTCMLTTNAGNVITFDDGGELVEVAGFPARRASGQEDDLGLGLDEGDSGEAG